MQVSFEFLLEFRTVTLIVCFLSCQFVTSVVSCCPAELKQEIDGKTETLKGFHVKLQDTILFPEGGGQVGAAPEPPSTLCYCLAGTK